MKQDFRFRLERNGMSKCIDQANIEAYLYVLNIFYF